MEYQVVKPIQKNRKKSLILMLSPTIYSNIDHVWLLRRYCS